MKRNVAGQIIGAQLVSATDGSAVTTGTTTVYVTGDGGTQAAGSVGSGAATHEGNGFWTYAPAQAETNYDHVAFTFVNSSAVGVTVQVWPNFPQTGDSFARIGSAGAGLTALGDTRVANLDATVSSRLATSGYTAPDNATITAIAGYVDTEVAAIKAKTDNLPASPAASGDIPSASTIAGAVWDEARAGHVTAGTFGEGVVVNSSADKTGYSLSTTGIDALFTRQLTESYAADGAAPTVAQALLLTQQILAEKSVAATTVTVKKLDGTTTAATFTLDDGTSPTSITRAT